MKPDMAQFPQVTLAIPTAMLPCLESMHVLHYALWIEASVVVQCHEINKINNMYECLMISWINENYKFPTIIYAALCPTSLFLLVSIVFVQSLVACKL